jgi:hypothetical protein
MPRGPKRREATRRCDRETNLGKMVTLRAVLMAIESLRGGAGDSH